MLIIPIYQMGGYGKIDYLGDVGKAGLILFSEGCAVVVSAEQSGAVQFFLMGYSQKLRVELKIAESKVRKPSFH